MTEMMQTVDRVIVVSLQHVYEGIFSSAGMFWIKTIVACIGRLGITMAFEMVVFVNTELYPTVIR